MTHKILKQEKNPLLHREAYLIEIQAESNPSFDDVRKIIGKDEKLVVIEGIKSNFGRKSFIASALVYDSEEARNKVEYIPRKIKKKLEEKAKKVEEEKAKAEEAKKAEEEKVKAESVAEKTEETPPVVEEKPIVEKTGETSE